MVNNGVPESLARIVCGQRYLLSALPVIEAAQETDQPIDQVARTYFAIGERLEFELVWPATW